MAFFSINPEKARQYVSSVSEYASLINKEGKKIHDKSEGNNHPVSTVEAATKPSGITPHVSVADPSKPAMLGATSFMGGIQSSAASSMANTIDGHAMQLVNYASEVECRRLEVVYLNSNGAATYNADGTLSYYLPDPPEGQDPAAYWQSMDVAKNVRQYNSQSVDNAKSDAKALYEVSNSPYGKSKDGRTAKQILANMEQHRDIPIYGSAFITGLGEAEAESEGDLEKNGARRFLDLLNRSRENMSAEVIPPGFETLSHILAAASQDEVGGKKLASDIFTDHGNSLNYTDRVSLNAALSIPPNPFGKDFLLGVAKQVEEYDEKKFGTEEIVMNGRKYNADILGGVLQAMGRNPEAAISYLADPKLGSLDPYGNWVPNDEGRKRLNRLENRKWNESGLDGYTAAIASASSFRNTSSTGVADADARATWISARAIRHFLDSYKKKDFTENMKANLGTVLANSPEEIAAAASGNSLAGVDISGPDMKGSVGKEDIMRLMYRVIDQPNVASTISASMGEFHRRDVEKHMNSNPSDPNDMFIKRYTRAANTEQLLRDVANVSLEDRKDADKAARDERKMKVDAGIAVFSTLATAGITAATAGAAAPVAVGVPLATDVGISFATPFASEYFTGKENKRGLPAVGDDAPVSSELFRAKAYTDAAKYGLVSPELEAQAQSQGIVYDSNGNVMEGGADGYTKTYVEQVNGWGDAAPQGSIPNQIFSVTGSGTKVAADRNEDTMNTNPEFKKEREIK